ncbi:Acetamidase [Hyaloscypha variabilis]
MAATQEPWQEIAARKRASVRALIPAQWLIPAAKLEEYKMSERVLHVPRESGILSAEEIKITESYDAVALAEELRAGETVNCLTEVFFEDAIARAKYLDEYLAREGKPLGPLHGLPISIKDGFNYPGVESTIGYVSLVGKSKAIVPSPLVKLLLDLGAVLYVKTNIPQTLMTADSDNNVFGRTLTPHKLTLTAGGSSGGEGALVTLVQGCHGLKFLRD